MQAAYLYSIHFRWYWNRIRAVPNIKSVGFKTGAELEQLIREALFSIYPSEWYENCPFSVMESQMYSTPVFGADIGGIPELIEVGNTGELFTPGDKTNLKQKIEKMWKDKEMINKYRRNCRNGRFDDIEEYYGKIMKIYEGKNCYGF